MLALVITLMMQGVLLSPKKIMDENFSKYPILVILLGS